MRQETADELAGYFGPQSVVWKVARESALVLGGGRAVLLQLAHPLVAAGVGDHSTYVTAPWQRFQGTLDLMQTLAFGTRSQAHAAARTINRMHIPVRGTLAEAAGALPVGTPFHARQPDLLLWVLATLVDTSLLLYPQIVGPLTREERERYYLEEPAAAGLLGLPPSAMPANLGEFEAYMRTMLEGDILTVTPEARRVARTVMRFPIPLFLWPVLRPARSVLWQATVSMLPAGLRAEFGFTWDDRRQWLLDREMQALHHLIPFLPAPLRYLPQARAALRRMRAYDRSL